MKQLHFLRARSVLRIAMLICTSALSIASVKAENFSGPSKASSTCQVPTNLTSNIRYNKFLELKWDAPEGGEDTSLQKAPQAKSAKYEFLKKMSAPITAITYIGSVGDYFYGSLELPRDSNFSCFIKFDFDGKILDTIRVDSIKGSFYDITSDGQYLYASVYEQNPTINKINPQTGVIEAKIPCVQGIVGKADRLTYISDLDGGKGGFEYGGQMNSFFVKMDGTKISNGICLDSIPRDPKAKIRATGSAYHNGIIYVLGNVTIGRNIEMKIWEFDLNGNYIKEGKDISDYKEGVYTNTRGLFVYTHKKTTYIVPALTLVIPPSRNYQTKLCFFEIESKLNLSGYNIYKNGIKANAALLQTRTYTETIDMEGNYKYGVTAVYDNDCESDTLVHNITIAPRGECAALASTPMATVVNRKNIALYWDKAEAPNQTILGYYLFKNNVQLNEQWLPIENFRDTNLANGTYTYKIKAVYQNSCLSDFSKEVSVVIDTVKLAQYPPTDLKGVSFIDKNEKTHISLNWENAKFSSDVTLSYSRMESIHKYGKKGAGVKWLSTQLAMFKDYSLTEVSFIAGDTGKYSVVVYVDGKRKPSIFIEAKNIIPNALNTIKLPNILKLDVTKELFVGILAKGDSTAKCITSDSNSILENGFYIYNFGNEEDPNYESWNQLGTESGNYNISLKFEALTKPSGEELSVDPNFLGYTIYKNDTKITSSPIKTIEYEDINLEDGNYAYYIASNWKEGKELKSNVLKKNATALYGAPYNLASTTDTLKRNVDLNWEKPLSGAPTIKRWDAGTNVNKLGIKQGGTISVAAFYAPEDIKELDEFSITEMQFYPTDRGLFTVFIYQDSNLLFEQKIADLTLDKFNTVILPKAIKIDASKSIKIGYRIQQGRNTKPIAYDGEIALPGKNLISMDNIKWEDALSQGIKGNWNIAFTAQYFNNHTVAKVGATKGKALTGYNVYRNEVKVNASPITTLNYTDAAIDPSIVECIYQIASVWADKSEVKSTPIMVNIPFKDTTHPTDTTSIEKQSDANLFTIYPNPAKDKINIIGAYTFVKIVDLSGKEVYQSNYIGTSIPLNTIKSGIYLMTIMQDKKQITKKISVLK